LPGDQHRFKLKRTEVTPSTFLCMVAAR
jgi:hypothetical protein